MSSFQLRSSYGFNGNTNLTPSRSEKAIDNSYESETDVTDVDEILPWLVRPEESTSANLASDKAVPFRPDGDTPKSRTSSFRYHRIRESSEHKAKVEVEGEDRAGPEGIGNGFPQINGLPVSKFDNKASISLTKACKACRRKKQACKHRKPVILSRTSITPSPIKANISAKCEGDVKVSKVKKEGNPQRKTAQDFSEGLSMTKNAVDYRLRKEIQAQYQERLAELLDDDIVEQVEQEGGITPLGRLYKASVRMLERVAEERAGRIAENRGALVEQDVTTDDSQVASHESMRQRAVKAEQQMQELKFALQALLDAH